MRAAVIGCGRMGLRHIQAIKELSFNIVGVTDLNEAALGNATAQFALRECSFLRAEELLAKTSPEVVVIATTAPSHREYIERCVNHGVKYILCEKPLAISLKDCEEIIKLCEKNKVNVAVNHQMRFLEQYRKPKELANSEVFGGLSSISVSAGNFGMAMNGTHYFEMARFMFDEFPRKVSAWFSEDDLPNPRGAQFKDKAGSMRLETPSGKRFYMDASIDQGHGIFVTYTCKYGQIVVDELAGMMYFSHRKLEFLNEPTTRYGQPSNIKSEKIEAVDVVSSTKAVISALITGKDYPNLYDSTYAIKALIAAYVSNDNGHIEIDIEKNSLPFDKVYPWA